MLIAVGSTNPTKIEPVKKVFEYHFKDIEVIGVDVESGVASQPMSDEEMYQGALNRAKNALKSCRERFKTVPYKPIPTVPYKPLPTYGVGIEGGLAQRPFGWFESSIVVIVNDKGEVGVGSSGGIVLPPKVIEMIHAGKNLEEAMDYLFGTTKIGKGIGMFGLMTKEYVTRSTGVEQGVAFALGRFLHPGLYE